MFGCDAIGSNCSHTVPDEVELASLLYTQATHPDKYGRTSLIDKTQIDYKSLWTCLQEAADSPIELRFWWDNRIVFPYTTEDGDYSYLIGRRTDRTEDKFYDNGIADKTGIKADTTTVTFTSDDYGRLMCEPPAIAVTPGTEVAFENDLPHEVSLTVEYSTDGAWSEGELTNLSPQPCPSGGTYLYGVDTPAGDVRGAVLATNSFRSQYQISPITEWLRETPQWQPDIAKYLKLATNKPWINPQAIDEPIYGIETVLEDHTLLITEGITDAIVAHQHDIPCISPAATNFKSKHHPEILAAAESASEVIVAMDNDANNAGLDGALKVTKMLRTSGVPAKITELPRPGNARSFDVADFLHRYSKESFLQYLREAFPPEEHPQYDPDVHNPGAIGGTLNQTGTERPQSSSRRQADQSTEGPSHETSNRSSRTDPPFNGSAIFDLTLFDAAAPQALSLNNCGGTNILGRGSNPLLADSPENSFVILSDESAYDHWISVKEGYTPLTWLLCDAGIRPADSPSGQLSDRELWEAWRHANETDYVTYPTDDGSWEDDPVPRRAMWHLANVHDVRSETSIPSSYDDTPLPTPARNEVLKIIMTEYGINPGRDIQT